MSRKDVVRTVLPFGLLGAAFYIVYFIAVYLSDMNPVAEPKYMLAALLAPVIVVSIYFFKKKINGSNLRFWQGIVLGSLVTLIVTASAAVFTWLFLEMKDPKPLAELIAAKKAMLQAQKPELIKSMGAGMYEALLKNMDMITPFRLVWSDFLKSSLVGFFITLVVSIALRK